MCSSDLKVVGDRVIQEAAKEVTAEISHSFYGKEVRIHTVYSSLIELMANTQDHAYPDDDFDDANWWLFSSVREDEAEFVFIDLGVGVFRSIPVKQYIHRQNLFSLRPGTRLDVTDKKYRSEELLKVYAALVSGEVKSSTGLADRGKGIPLIYQNARDPIFDRLTLIANDAFIDFKSDRVSVMDEEQLLPHDPGTACELLRPGWP